jgi:hypothetical protein
VRGGFYNVGPSAALGVTRGVPEECPRSARGVGPQRATAGHSGPQRLRLGWGSIILSNAVQLPFKLGSKIFNFGLILQILRILIRLILLSCPINL